MQDVHQQEAQRALKASIDAATAPREKPWWIASQSEIEATRILRKKIEKITKQIAKLGEPSNDKVAFLQKEAAKLADVARDEDWQTSWADRIRVLRQIIAACPQSKSLDDADKAFVDAIKMWAAVVQPEENHDPASDLVTRREAVALLQQNGFSKSTAYRKLLTMPSHDGKFARKQIEAIGHNPFDVG